MESSSDEEITQELALFSSFVLNGIDGLQDSTLNSELQKLLLELDDVRKNQQDTAAVVNELVLPSTSSSSSSSSSSLSAIRQAYVSDDDDDDPIEQQAQLQQQLHSVSQEPCDVDPSDQSEITDAEPDGASVNNDVSMIGAGSSHDYHDNQRDDDDDNHRRDDRDDNRIRECN